MSPSCFAVRTPLRVWKRRIAWLLMFSLQIACADPSVAWPQRSTSTVGVNQRSPQPSSARVRNAVSARFISAATFAIHWSSRAPSMKQTAAGFPLNASLVKASTWSSFNSESLYRRGFRIHPACEEEAEDDHAGEAAVADERARAVDGRIVIADHEEDQRHGHVRVLARAEAGLSHGLGVGRGLIALHTLDDLLLIRPDHHPDVKGHHRAEDAAGVDVERASTVVAAALERAVDDGEEDEVDRAGDDNILDLLQHEVVDHESNRQRDQDDGQPEPRITDVILVKEHGLGLVVDEAEEQEAGNPRPRRAPAEPEKRARHQLGHDELFGRRVQLAGEGAVDEVEEPKVSDPHHAGDDVTPSENELHPVVQIGIHMLSSISTVWGSLRPIICRPKNLTGGWQSSPEPRQESDAQPRRCCCRAAQSWRRSREVRRRPDLIRACSQWMVTSAIRPESSAFSPRRNRGSATATSSSMLRG